MTGGQNGRHLSKLPARICITSCRLSSLVVSFKTEIGRLESYRHAAHFLVIHLKAAAGEWNVLARACSCLHIFDLYFIVCNLFTEM